MDMQDKLPYEIRYILHQIAQFAMAYSPEQKYNLMAFIFFSCYMISAISDPESYDLCSVDPKKPLSVKTKRNLYLVTRVLMVGFIIKFKLTHL
jgi:hypothetical protein